MRETRALAALEHDQMLAPDMNARYVAITLEIALNEARRAEIPEPARGLLISLLTLASGATAELCEALPPRCDIREAHLSPPVYTSGENVFPFKRTQ